MHLIRSSLGFLKLASRFAALLLTGACTALPASVSAQEIRWFVLHEPGNASRPFTVFTADCGAINPTAASQPVSCTLRQGADCRECTSTDPKKCEGQPGICPFVVRSTDLPPAVLVFGYSAASPGCGWVWDPYKQKYVWRCY